MCSSDLLRKISEIYDRIAFAGVGKYNEYDSLRMAGVRQADLQGYQFSRRDVDARRLANLYAQVLAHEFTAGPKPLEVEILVAEVGESATDDRLYRISYDGTVMDEDGLCILGGDSEAVAARCAGWQHDNTFAGLLKAATGALSGPDRSLVAADLEVAVLARNGRRRCFSRLEVQSVAQMLG